MLRDEENLEYQAYKRLRDNPEDSQNPAKEENREKQDILQEFQNASAGVQLSGSCIPSFTINALGKSFTVDTTRFCGALEITGYIIMVLASIIAVRVFVGGD